MRWLAIVAVLAAASVVRSASIADFSWLSGCWSHEDAEPGSDEIWSSPAGGIMLGMSRTVRGGKTVEHEFMSIRQVSAGQLAFVAHPSGQQEAAFPLVRSGATELVFENLEHDFPQRIIYRLAAPDRLVARIEGKHEGGVKGIDFPMTRGKCPP